MVLIPFAKCPRVIGSAGSHDDMNRSVQVLLNHVMLHVAAGEGHQKSQNQAVASSFILMCQSVLTVTAFYTSSEPRWSLLHLVSLLLIKNPQTHHLPSSPNAAWTQSIIPDQSILLQDQCM